MTKSGKPIVAGDPHLNTIIPTSFWLCELSFDDTFVAGGTLPGVPLFQGARNKNMAWSPTALYADISDIFEEWVEGDFYEFKGQMIPLEKYESEIHVKGGASETHTLRLTHHGPLMDDIDAVMHHIDDFTP